MKVSMIPKAVETPTEPGTDLPVDGQNEDVQVINPTEAENDIDKYLSQSGLGGEIEGSEEVVNELDPYGALGVCLNSTTADFATLTVPSVAEIVAKADLELTERTDFYDAIERRLLELRDKVELSIVHIRDALDKVPQHLVTVLKQVMEKREDDIRQIDLELSYIDPLKEKVMKICDQEIGNLSAFGKKCYEWSIAHQNGDLFEGETADYSNMPDPRNFGLDLNGDGLIGDPTTTNLAVASRTIEVDGEFIEIFEVIDKDLHRPASFDAEGNVLGVGSCKQTDYVWTVSHGNLEVIDPKDHPDGVRADAYFRVLSTESQVYGNGQYGLPIDLSFGEYMWVDEESGEPLAFEMVGGELRQVYQEGAKLERIVSVELKKKTATNVDDRSRSDHYVVIRGDRGQELMSIQIAGKDDVAASDLAIGVNGGLATDKFRRTSGLHVEAKKLHSTVNEQNSAPLVSSIIGSLEMEYGVANPDKPEVYDASVQQQGTNIGLTVYNLSTVSGTLSRYNDIVAVDGPEAEYEDYIPEDSEDTLPPLATTAVRFGLGHNAIFYKGEEHHVFADNVSLAIGRGNGDAYLTTPAQIGEASASNYINLDTEEHVEIANRHDDPEWNSFGINDDAYVLNTVDVVFGAIYEPEITEDPDYDGLYPAAPDGATPNDVSSEQWAEVEIAVTQDIQKLTKEQSKAHLEALRELQVEETNEEEYEYTGEGINGGAYEAMKQQMNTFFEGWESWTGGFTGLEEIPGLTSENQDVSQEEINLEEELNDLNM